MGEQNLKKIAVKHFATFGYEGTRLSRIAKEAGMKKQSLYSHFKDKDDLLLKVNEMVLEEEIIFLQSFFQKNASLPLKDTLYTLLIEYKKRYLNNSNKSFMFLMGFAPPFPLRAYFTQNYHLYLTCLKTLLKTKFQEQPHLRIDPDDGPTSFVILLDGVFIQLIFETPKDFDNSLRICWDIYWNGLIRIE